MAFDPSAHFSLLDVQLWETKLKRGIEYSPALHEGQLGAQTRKAVVPQRLEVEDYEGVSHEMLRVIVHLGLRGLHVSPEAEQGDESEVDRVLFELETSFAVVYHIKSEPSDDDLMDFVRLNCVHNAWPFWRQHVFDTLKRASLPVLPIPFFQMGKADETVVLDDESSLDIE